MTESAETQKESSPVKSEAASEDSSTQTQNALIPSYDPSIYPGYKHTFTKKEKQQFYFTDGQKKQFNAQLTAERYKYLLEITDIFSKFLDTKAEKDPKFAEVLEIVQKSQRTDKTKVENRRGRRTEREEDEELLKEDDEDANDEKTFEFSDSPAYVNGKMRSYQVQGLNWLIALDANHLSGILADEMGLGKTLQTISFLGYLRYIRKIPGPHLVIVPKSTLTNWKREFSHWTPEVNTVVLTGDRDERNATIAERIMPCDFDVLISSYEIVIKEKSTLKKFDWQYIVVDEAHRLKNEDSLLSQIIRMFHSHNRLLLTGTPLQNNLHELWALLNFLLPDIFTDSEQFDEWFSGENEDSSVVHQLHKVLHPFLLRRIKAEVERSLLPKKELNLYVGMSQMQKQWYQKILERDIDAVNGANGKKESKTRLLNIAMQLRKCCNHPYLFDGAEPGPPYTNGEHLVYNCGKMLVLDRLLKRVKEQGSRVLIFSQMSRMLDILEDYATMRKWKYCRIDGQTDHADRIRAIDDYNDPDSDKFLFLLTTRAGGLGINLTSADVVVLYDSDWNPQADLQAMDRAHRIGQKKQVKVFRLVTEDAIEEKIIERASQKLRLDQLVIQQGRGVAPPENKSKSKGDLLNMIQHGASKVLGENKDGGEVQKVLSDAEMDRIFTESQQKTSKLRSRFETLGLNDLQNFSSDQDSVYEWNGKNFQKKQFSKLGKGSGLGVGAFTWIEPARRERKGNYSVDQYYRDVLNTHGPSIRQRAEHKGIKAPKHLNLYDHQFYPMELWALHDLENNHFKKLVKEPCELAKGTKDTLDIRKLDQQLLETEVKHSRRLTDEEEAKKESLLHAEGSYGKFSRRDFFTFVGVSAKYGRNDVAHITAEFSDKPADEVVDYARAFWHNFRQIDGYERQIGHIEQGEDRIRKLAIQKEVLRRKMSEYEYPLNELTFKYPPRSSHTKNVFTEDEDRYLVVEMFRIGIDNPNLYETIRQDIKHSSMFHFDYFFTSRTATELNRRCITLLGAIQKEYVDQFPAWYINRKREREESATPERKRRR